MYNASLQVGKPVPSSRRPIPLVARPDLVVERIGYRGNEDWVLKIPGSLKYFRLRSEQFFLLQRLDGQSTLETLHEQFRGEFPAMSLQLADIQRIVIDLYEKGLAYSDRPGQGGSLVKCHFQERRKKLLANLQNMLSVQMPGWDPYNTLNRLYRYCRWMFHPAAVFAALAAVAAAWILVLVHFDEFHSRLPEFHQFFGWENVIYLWITMAAVKIFHELGHALSCKHFGGECHQIGVMLLVFTPTLYCDVSDSWMLRSKWQRIAVGGAGMYVESVISAVAIFIWWYTQPGLLNHVCLNVFFITMITTTIFNANPLMRYDGYYMLADLLEIPNLRLKADKMLRDTFARYCLGIQSRPDPFMPETGRAWFVAFAVAAWTYRWIVVFGITMFLYSFLKPYELQSIGATLAAASVTAMVFGASRGVYQTISAPRPEPISKYRTTVTVATLALLLSLALWVPIPWHREAPFLIEPFDVKEVYTTVPGELVAVNASFGQPVHRGQVLAHLSNYELQQKYASLKRKEQVQQAEADSENAAENWSANELAQQKLAMLKREVAECEEQIQHLTITAPCSGTLVAPTRKAKRSPELKETELGSWSGTAIDVRNERPFLPESTPIADIASTGDFQAVLLIDQADRRDLSVGQAVDLKLEHLPDRNFSGVVAEISKRELKFIPRAISNKHGGSLPTVADSQGREKSSNGVMYQAKVRLDQETPLMMAGMRGQARFVVSSRTPAEWIWQSCRRTFHFRL